jgi:hypothetical protein
LVGECWIERPGCAQAIRDRIVRIEKDAGKTRDNDDDKKKRGEKKADKTVDVLHDDSEGDDVDVEREEGTGA